jgi:hypothetical protein
VKVVGDYLFAILPQELYYEGFPAGKYYLQQDSTRAKRVLFSFIRYVTLM